ncbi:phosducin 3 [Olea europaea subsp. europaea]|uniref:Phosducin 3 n=1 Tax=Olea europaea subsp. europaea TaxID=158383 RepID=A0A8S0PJ57_OLEEU|nr:phosducin 3 [Olea europaea subsp. europaea]
MFTLECLQLFKEFLHELYKSEFEEVEEKDPFNPKMPIKKQDEYIEEEIDGNERSRQDCPVRFVVPISGSDFVREVSQASPDVWVVVMLYKDGYNTYQAH